MFLYQSAYLDQNLYQAGYPGHMHQVQKIQRRERKYVNTYIWLANWRFGNVELQHCQCVWQMPSAGKVAFHVELPSTMELAGCVGQVEMHLFLCISRVSADSVRCHFGKEGIRPSRFDEAWRGVGILQPSPSYAPETQHPASSVLESLRKVS